MIYANIPNGNQIIYPKKYAGGIVNQLIAVNNTGKYPKKALQYTNQPYNQPNNPQTIIQGLNYKFQNIPIILDTRKTYTPALIKNRNVNQIYPQNVQYKPQKNSPKGYTQVYSQNNNVKNNQQQTLYLIQENGNIAAFKTSTYHPQLKNNLSASVNNNMFSSINPNQNKVIYQNKKSPIIENITSTIFNSQINEVAQLNPSSNNNNQEIDLKKSATLLTVSCLANLPYNAYPEAEYSHEAFYNIAGYGINSYNGKIKNFNEDRTKVIVNHNINQNFIINGVQVKPCISYFGIFDGHSGKKCSDFLKENLDSYLFNSSFFPKDPIKAIRESFKKAEDNFCAMAYDPNNNIMLDKSGSCALVMLIINNILFSINLGDSRALYSYNTGKYLLQITRDHKPNDEIEKKRIENAGGQIYYANTVKRNGKEIKLNEEDFGKGFSFPYRILPGKIAVSLFYNNLGCKNYWRLLL